MNREQKKTYRLLVGQLEYHQVLVTELTRLLSKMKRGVKEENFSTLDAYISFLRQCRKQKAKTRKAALEWMKTVEKELADLKNTL